MVVAVASAAVTVVTGGAAAPVIATVVNVAETAGSAVVLESAVSVAVGAAANAGASAGTAIVAGTSAALGPIGWLALGAEEMKLEDGAHTTYTFDCWKPVLHDESSEPSKGKLLRDVVGDSRVTHATITPRDDSPYPNVILHNIWMEQFNIEYVQFPDGVWAAHAVLMV